MFDRRERTPRPAYDEFRSAMAPGLGAAHVFTLAMNLLALTVPLYMLQLYDRVLSSGSERTLILLTVVAVFSLGIFALLDGLRGALIARRAAYAARMLARRVTEAVAERSRDPAISMGPFLRDVETMRSKEVAPASTAAMDAPYAVIFFVILFWLHWSFAFVAALGAIALATQAFWSDRRTEEPLGKAFAGQAAAARFADSAFAARDAVHAMGMVPAIAQKFLVMDAEARAHQRIASDRESAFGSSGRMTRMLTQLALLGLGAYLVLIQEATAGAMVTSGIIGARALLPIESAVSGWRIIVAARQAAGRLDSLLASTPRTQERSQIPGLKGSIEVDKAYVAPPGSQNVTLKGIDLTINPGEFVCIAGPSGSGKSTLARLIAGAWRPHSGVVRIGGVDANALSVEDRTKLIGYVPQEAQLTGGTVRETISRLTDGSMEAVTAAAHKARAHEMIINLPNAYDRETGPAGSALSGGQRQRIALARALYGAPRIVVLDEPGAGLDRVGAASLAETLRELKAGGVTIVLVSHQEDQILAADKVVVMRGDGTIDRIGVPKTARTGA